MAYSTEGDYKVKRGNKSMGDLGESYAKGYYKQQGYTIIRAPFKCRSGEIDAVILDGKTLVFVEVKTRRSLHYGNPLEAVTPAKQRQIAKIAQVYLTYFNKHDFDNCRFDVLGILVNQSTGEVHVEHVKDAFRMGESGSSFSC